MAFVTLCCGPRTSREVIVLNMILDALKLLAEGGSPDADLAYAAMSQIMSGEATDAQIGAYLTALRIRGETAEAIEGSLRAMREVFTPVSTPGGVLVDTCGTGGRRNPTINNSTAAPNVDFLQAFPHWLFLTGASLSFLVLFSLMHLPFAWKRRATRRERAESSA